MMPTNINRENLSRCPRGVVAISFCFIAIALIWCFPATTLAQEQAEPARADAEVVEAIQDLDAVEMEDLEGDEEVEVQRVMANPWGIGTNQLVAAKKFQLLQVFKVEVDEMRQVCDLNKKQTLKLRIGAKGAAEKITNQWKKKMARQMGQFPQVQPANEQKDAADEEEVEFEDADEIDVNVWQSIMMDNFGGNPYKSDDPTANRFWKKTVSSVLTEQQQKSFSRYKEVLKTAKRKALTDGTISCLRVELGLTAEQLVEFEKIVRPSMENAKMDCIALYEPYLIYYHASKSDNKELAKLLSPAQLQKWKIFMAPMKQIGEMMEMEGEFGMPEEEMNILAIAAQVLEEVAEGLEDLLSQYFQQ